MGEDFKIAATDSQFLENLALNWDADEELAECYAAAARHYRSLPADERLNAEHNGLNEDDFFLEEAESRIYLLEKSKNSRDIALGRIMAEKIYGFLSQ